MFINERMVALRKHLAVREPILHCPRCATVQLQLFNWAGLPIWKCRECGYKWEELSWGEPRRP